MIRIVFTTVRTLKTCQGYNPKVFLRLEMRHGSEESIQTLRGSETLPPRLLELLIQVRIHMQKDRCYFTSFTRQVCQLQIVQVHVPPPQFTYCVIWGQGLVHPGPESPDA